MNAAHLAALRYYAAVTVLCAPVPEDIDASRKALLRARLINGNLELTEAGRRALAIAESHRPENDVLIVAPFTLPPYCRHPGVKISASEERPCRLVGHEVFTATGCAVITEEILQGLTLKIHEGRYFGQLWQG